MSTQRRIIRGTEAAAIIGVNRTQFYRWLNAGDAPPPSQTICGNAYWDSALIEGFVAGDVTKDAEGIWRWPDGSPVRFGHSRWYNPPTPKPEDEDDWPLAAQGAA